MRTLWPILALTLLAGTHPPISRAATGHRPTLADLGFMSGCWRGPSDGGGVINEYYTPPSDNLMLGMARYTKGKRVTTYEFTTIAVEGDSDLVFTPRPAGQTPADFRLAKLEPGVAVWKNPAHDFPQMITYRKLGKDSLVARIEGPGANGTESSEWKMGKVPCGT